jgi:hypothetical protein
MDGGPSTEIHPMAQIDPSDRTCPPEETTHSSVHKAHKEILVCETTMFLGHPTARRRKTPIVEDGSTLLRNHVPTCLSSRDVRLMARGLLEVIHGLAKGTPGGLGMKVVRKDTRGLH